MFPFLRLPAPSPPQVIKSCSSQKGLLSKPHIFSSKVDYWSFDFFFLAGTTVENGFCAPLQKAAKERVPQRRRGWLQVHQQGVQRRIRVKDEWEQEWYKLTSFLSHLRRWWRGLKSWFSCADLQGHPLCFFVLHGSRNASEGFTEWLSWGVARENGIEG